MKIFSNDKAVISAAKKLISSAGVDFLRAAYRLLFIAQKMHSHYYWLLCGI